MCPQSPSGPPGTCFTEKYIKTKLLIGLKVTAWISFWTSTDIKGKLGAVPVGQHHLVPQEHILQKSTVCLMNLFTPPFFRNGLGYVKCDYLGPNLMGLGTFSWIYNLKGCKVTEKLAFVF